MTLPVDLILIRHGESEANIVQQKLKKDPTYDTPQWYREKHDSKMNLSDKGREQATAAGNWLRENGYGDNFFNSYYVSPHTRTCQTAGLLALNGEWYKDDRWRERDWGVYGMSTKKEREEKYGDSTEIRGRSEWYWKPTGGESLATGVRLRFETILDKLHRDTNPHDNDSAVIAVAHGEMLRVAQFVLERMSPDDWNRQETENNSKISNCQILHYSRRNPYTGEITKETLWRRSINPYDPEKSWDNGEWVKLVKKLYTDTDLLEIS